jgi:hypothetical protein
VAPGEIGLLDVSPRSDWYRDCAWFKLGIDKAQGFFECALAGISERYGRSYVAGDANSVTESGVPVRVSTWRSRSCSKGSLHESVYVVSRTLGRLELERRSKWDDG